MPSRITGTSDPIAHRALHSSWSSGGSSALCSILRIQQFTVLTDWKPKQVKFIQRQQPLELNLPSHKITIGPKHDACGITPSFRKRASPPSLLGSMPSPRTRMTCTYLASLSSDHAPVYHFSEQPTAADPVKSAMTGSHSAAECCSISGLIASCRSVLQNPCIEEASTPLVTPPSTLRGTRNVAPVEE